MQQLTAGPRAAYTDPQVRALLGASTLRVGKGVELLTPDLRVREDISMTLVTGTIKRNMSADIHGTCALTLARELAWGVDLVRPYMTLDDGRTRARWNVGVFALTTPKTTIGPSLRTYTVDGYDRLFLLQRQVGRDYTLPAGMTYAAALTQVFTDAGLTGVLIDSSATALTLPAVKSWPLVPSSTDPDQASTPTTWLRVINDLLTAINYRGVWADQDGYYRCEQYQPPAQRGAEYHFDADAGLRLLGPQRVRTVDVWATPNRWVFIAQNPPDGVTPSQSNGLVYARDNLEDGPLSQAPWPAGRGLVWPATYTYDAATPDVLASLGDRRVAVDLATTTTFDVTTSPFPGAGHADVFTYADVAAGGTRRVQAASWSMPMSSAQMSWTWEVVS